MGKRYDLLQSVAALKRDRHFAQLIKKYGLPELKRGKNIFQALARSIVYQQLSGKAAATILGRFVALFPKGTFPAPEAVQKMSIHKMRAAGLSVQKASYIKDLADKFVGGTVRHRSLHRLTSEEIIEHLVQVKGVGVWTVHMLLIFTLGRPDVLPTGDLGIRKGFQLVYGLKELPTKPQMEHLAKEWRAHASVASWYLWRAADSARPKPRAKEGEVKEI